MEKQQQNGIAVAPVRRNTIDQPGIEMLLRLPGHRWLVFGGKNALPKARCARCAGTSDVSWQGTHAEPNDAYYQTLYKGDACAETRLCRACLMVELMETRRLLGWEGRESCKAI